MRNSIFGLLTNDFAEWQENEAGSTTVIVTNLTHLTPLANKLLGRALLDSNYVWITMSLDAPLENFLVITVLYENHKTDYNFHLKDLTKEL